MVQGWIRVLAEASDSNSLQSPKHVHAVRAELLYDLHKGPVGWNLSQYHIGIGRHFSDHFQDPSIAHPGMSGKKYRTTLLKDSGEWYVLELCEPLDGIIDPTAEFYGYEGSRDVITIITDAEKDPSIMGFRLVSDAQVEPVEHERFDAGDIGIAPEDEVRGQDIGDGVIAEGAEVPQHGKLVAVPSPTDKVLIDGVELNASSSLQALRTALTGLGISTSGSKQKCFERLLNYQKKHELEVLQSAVAKNQQSDERKPKAQPLHVPPSQELQDLHNLTHCPYQPWCPSCIAHQARADAHRSTGAARQGGSPTVSFDFAYVKNVPDGREPKDISAVTCLVMTDSSTGFTHATPVRSKNQYQLMVQELLTFCQLLGHTSLTLRCDNEPTLVQLMRMAVNARLSLGLPTKAFTPMAYSHSNSLVENVIGRARALAASLMHALSEKVGVCFSTNSALWSWAVRHACWILNRFSPAKAITAFELVYGNDYKGSLCQFGEPVFGYARS